MLSCRFIIIIFWGYFFNSNQIIPQNNSEQIESIDYLGLSKPGSIPVIFAPDFVSTQYAEFAGTFSPDFKEYYFTRRGPFPDGAAQIMVTKRVNDSWTIPEIAPFSSGHYEFEPFITPDGNRLYFGSRRSPDGIAPPGTMHQWYLEKSNSGWSDPILLGSPFFERMVMYPTVSNTGTIYFTGLDGIYYSELIAGSYLEPVRMGEEINFLPLTAHSFIAPDESYLIFDGQPRGEGLSDLYISYRRIDGTWTKGKPFGSNINSGVSQAIASISPDGECLFFTRNSDIYWTDAAIIDEIRLIPEINIQPDSGSAPLIVNFSFNEDTVPELIDRVEWDFNNDGVVDSFDEAPVFEFSQPGTYSIKVEFFTQSDSAEYLIPDAVKVIENTTGVEADRLINYNFLLEQNFPNPFNPKTKIKFLIPPLGKGITVSQRVSLNIYDILGNKIDTLVDDLKAPGSYQINFDASELAGGVYFYQLRSSGFCKAKKMILLK